MAYKILAVNPGSTSTKIAVYEGVTPIFEQSLYHSADELKGFARIADQFDFRKSVVLEALRAAGVPLDSIDAVIGRGGLVKPIPSGIYEMNAALHDDLVKGVSGEHASNLGGLVAESIAAQIGVRAFIADPVVVDELADVARICGLPQMERVSIFHALNQKAVAREYAAQRGLQYEQLNLVVAHLGGGISVGAHRQGRVVDVNNALEGEGPFSPERAGSLPTGQLVTLCFSGKYSESEIRKMLCGRGGMIAHLGTNNIKEGLALAEHDPKARLVMDALAYNVGKAIGAAAAVLEGRVDAIIITGGIAHNPMITSYIERMTRFIAPVEVRPGEDELGALASNALRVLEGPVEVSTYK